MKEKLKTILTLLIVFCFIGAIVQFILICKNDLVTPDNLVDEQAYYISINGKTEKYIIEKYREGGSVVAYLVKKSFTKKQGLKLSGFETDISIYKEETNNIDNKKIICLFGDVGAHSQNIELINLADGKMRPIKIKNADGVVENIFSDVPKFYLEQKDSLTLTIETRDYETDPTLFAKRETYLLGNDQFVFDSAENISYTSDSSIGY